MGFVAGFIFGTSLGFFLAVIWATKRFVEEAETIVDGVNSYKESVDKAINLVYEVAEKNKKLESEKKEREFMEKMLKGEPGPDDWRRL